MFIIKGKIIINSMSNIMKIIIMYRKFIDILIFLLLKLLNPHSMLLKLFLFFLKLLINLIIILIIKKIINVFTIKFIFYIYFILCC